MQDDVSPEVREFISSHRVGRLATADAQGAPHVIPICYAYDGSHIYSALDLKPKRVSTGRLKRVRNIVANPRVALVIDDYSEDWDRLGYVMIQGSAQLVEAGDERSLGEDLLRKKYPQYATLLPEGGTMLKITPRHIVSWGRI